MQTHINYFCLTMDMKTRQEFDEELELIKSSTEKIVVEGPNDKKALVKVGISARRIITLNKPLYRIIEIVLKTKQEVIILTDLDKKGKELYGKINHDCQQFGIRVNNRFREFLFKTQLRQIEGLANYREKLQ